MANKRERVTGHIIEVLGAGLYVVRTEHGINERCRPKKKMLKNKIHFILGDEVTIEMVESSETHWIIWRGKLRD